MFATPTSSQAFQRLKKAELIAFLTAFAVHCVLAIVAFYLITSYSNSPMSDNGSSVTSISVALKMPQVNKAAPTDVKTSNENTKQSEADIVQNEQVDIVVSTLNTEASDRTKPKTSLSSPSSGKSRADRTISSVQSTTALVNQTTYESPLAPEKPNTVIQAQETQSEAEATDLIADTESLSKENVEALSVISQEEKGIETNNRAPHFQIGGVLNPKPPYPTIARKRNWEGKVLLGVHVADDGSVSELELLKGSGHTVLDNSALNTIRDKWQFTPAEINGSAVNGYVEVPIAFNIR